MLSDGNIVGVDERLAAENLSFGARYFTLVLVKTSGVRQSPALSKGNKICLLAPQKLAN